MSPLITALPGDLDSRKTIEVALSSADPKNRTEDAKMIKKS